MQPSLLINVNLLATTYFLHYIYLSFSIKISSFVTVVFYYEVVMRYYYLNELYNRIICWFIFCDFDIVIFENWSLKHLIQSLWELTNNKPGEKTKYTFEYCFSKQNLYYTIEDEIFLFQSKLHETCQKIDFKIPNSLDFQYNWSRSYEIKNK